MAADVDIVVQGVNKGVSGEQVSSYITNKGVEVIDCSLLTTYEDAQTLSYKITIKAGDYNKSRDPAFWPNRVRVCDYRKPIENRDKITDRIITDKLIGNKITADEIITDKIHGMETSDKQVITTTILQIETR